MAKRIDAITRQDTDSGDEDAEAKAAAERAQRRKVIALNKLAEAAQTVRRQFIAEKLLARKTPLKGAAIFLAHCLTRDVRLIEEHRAGDIAAQLLGVTDLAAVTTLVEGLPATGDGRAQVLTLALVLGALEARTPKDAWRSVPGLGYVRHVGPAELLGFLAQHGYELSDVEQVMTGQQTSEGVYSETARRPDWRCGVQSTPQRCLKLESYGCDAHADPSRRFCPDRIGSMQRWMPPWLDCGIRNGHLACFFLESP